MKEIYLVLFFVHGFNILLLNYTTMAICPNSGVEIDLLNKGLNSYGYVQGTDYTIECVSSIDIIRERIKTENAIGFGGIRINQVDMLDGYYFTHPTYYSGLNVLVSGIALLDSYTIFTSFQIQVWILFVFSPLILGILSWIYAIILSDNPKEVFSDFYMLGELIWESYAAWMFSSELYPKKVGKLLDVSLSVFMFFFFLVMVASLTSDNYQKLLTFITKFGDLAGQLVLIEPQYEDVCGQYSIYYYEFEQDFYNDFDLALNLLQQGDFLGIVADNTYLLNKTYGLNFTINTYPFITFSYAGIYGNGLSKDTAKIINKALSSVQSTEYPSELINQYHLFYDISLKTQYQVTISSCQYLFIILISAILLAFMLTILPINDFYLKIWDCCCKKKLQQFDELELTSRTEGLEIINQQGIDYRDKFDNDWGSDMKEDYLRIIRISTLSIIEYENNTLEWIDKIIADLKHSNMEKLDIINNIEAYLK